MMEMTQNIRKMYAYSKGKAELELESISLNECVDFINEQFKNELNQKNISIQYDFNSNKDFKILVEPISFKYQVLGNLINNAIKFSHSNSNIFIEIRPIKGNIYSIDVRDEGIGIPKNLLPIIFKANQTTTRTGTNGELGSGFGLIIMKTFMELYGGAVNVRSLPLGEHKNHGTTFSLILEAV
jgi:signal transduction histidine kinase